MAKNTEDKGKNTTKTEKTKKESSIKKKAVTSKITTSKNTMSVKKNPVKKTEVKPATEEKTKKKRLAGKKTNKSEPTPVKKTAAKPATEEKTKKKRPAAKKTNKSEPTPVKKTAAKRTGPEKEMVLKSSSKALEKINLRYLKEVENKEKIAEELAAVLEEQKQNNEFEATIEKESKKQDQKKEKHTAKKKKVSVDKVKSEADSKKNEQKSEERQNEQKEISQQTNQTTEKDKQVKEEPQKYKLNIEQAEIQEINPEMLIDLNEIKIKKIEQYYQSVLEFMKNTLFVDKNVKILIGVSGGVDSVTLVDTLVQLSRKYNMILYLGHFNHKLRGKSSERDEKFVRDLAKIYNLPVYIGSGKVQQYSDKNSISIEQAARELRYKFFERTVQNLKANFIATAHNSDDSAETFLINLFRGSGLTGLCGIPAKRQFVKNAYLIRPLLNVSKSEIIGIAKFRKLQWVEDESNRNLNFTRNRIRHDLLPKLAEDYNPAIKNILNRASYHINGAEQFIYEYIQNNINMVLLNKSSDQFYMKIPMLQTYDEFIQGELIQYAVKKQFRLQSLPLNMIERIINLFKHPVGSIIEITKNILVLRDRQSYIFSRKGPSFDCDFLIERTGKYRIGNYDLILSEVKSEDIVLDPDPNVEFFDAEFMPLQLNVRSWRQGDVMVPLGMEGHMKISDLLTNLKMPLINKNNIVVLSDKVDIFWVCGVRMGDKYKVTQDSKQIIKAEYINISEHNEK